MGTLLPDCPHGVGLCTDSCPRKLALERLGAPPRARTLGEVLERIAGQPEVIVPAPSEPEVCGCDQANGLAAELAEMKADRDKLLVRVSNLEWMRDNLRARLEHAQAQALPEAAAGSEGAPESVPQTGNGASEGLRPAAAPGPIPGEFG